MAYESKRLQCRECDWLLVADSGKRSAPPLSKTMRKRNYKNFCIALENDHRIRESSEYKSFDTTSSGNAWQ
jgi:hypothetical protein